MSGMKTGSEGAIGRRQLVVLAVVTSLFRVLSIGFVGPSLTSRLASMALGCAALVSVAVIAAFFEESSRTFGPKGRAIYGALAATVSFLSRVFMLCSATLTAAVFTEIYSLCFSADLQLWTVLALLAAAGIFAARCGLESLARFGGLLSLGIGLLLIVCALVQGPNLSTDNLHFERLSLLSLRDGYLLYLALASELPAIFILARRTARHGSAARPAGLSIAAGFILSAALTLLYEARFGPLAAAVGSPFMLMAELSGLKSPAAALLCALAVLRIGLLVRASFEGVFSQPIRVRRAVAGLAVCAALTLLSGCSGQTELSERRIVGALALDFEGKGYMVSAATFTCPDAAGADEGFDDRILEAETERPSDALALLGEKSREPLYSGHCAGLIFGGQLEGQLFAAAEALFEQPSLRSVKVYLAAGEAADALDAVTEAGPVAGQLEDLELEVESRGGKSPVLADLLSLEKGFTGRIYRLRLDDKELKLCGYVDFVDAQPLGTVSTE